MAKYYLGLASTFHDSALAILDEDGQQLFAEATERHLQFKRALNCIPDNFGIGTTLKRYCQPNSQFIVGTSWSQKHIRQLDRMARWGFFEHKILEDSSFQGTSKFLYPKSLIYAVMGLHHNCLKQIGKGLWMEIRKELPYSQVEQRGYSHHLAHAAHGCYTSGFDEACCLVVDGFGEQSSLSVFEYRDDQITPAGSSRGPESLGLLYELMAVLCGFDWFKGEEWKVMGLAPYGQKDEEKYQLFKSLCWYEKGRLRYPPLDELSAIVQQLYSMVRPPGSSPYEAADMAWAGQRVFSEVMTDVLLDLQDRHKSRNLVLCGGCALNSSFNGTILERTRFERLYVPSAPADDGPALGAAMLALKEDQPRRQVGIRTFQSPYLGSRMSSDALGRLKSFGHLPNLRHLPLTVHKEAARCLAEGKLLGWIQGRAEFGPRALGNRSILADPRPADMKDKINQRVKFREPFRPFAPSILHEFGSEYFENYQESPYMERTLLFRPQVAEKVPAVVHANRSGRLQTVKREWNPKFYNLIKAFYDITGIPLLLNTSLNVMGKPIVHSVEDALGMFFTTGLDVLVIGDFIIDKSADSIGSEAAGESRQEAFSD